MGTYILDYRYNLNDSEWSKKMGVSIKRKVMRSTIPILNLILGIIVLADLLFAPTLQCQDSRLVSAIVEQSGDDYNKLLKAIHEHENLLKKYNDSDFAPTVIFQLAELYSHKAEMHFDREMRKYDKELEKYDRGEIAVEPVTPRISFRETIDLLYRLLSAYPRLDFRDRVLYLLAKSHLEEGNREKAKQYFEDIIKTFPKSQISLESHFRLGEYYFEKRDFKTAIKHYTNLINEWDSPYFDMSLYKLGWAYYIINEYVNAIGTFIYLIEDISMVEETNSITMGKSKLELRDESIQYIASCFTEYEGPQKAKHFLEPRKDKDYTLAILLQMGELYQKRNYYPEVIETFEILLELYPFYEQAPELYKLIVESYEADDRIDEANKTREEIIRKFGPSGPWLTFYPEGEIRQTALKMAHEALFELGTYYQAQAQKKGRAREYRMAVDKYQEFLEKFPDASKAATVNYYLAESLYESGDLAAAADAYHDVATKYDSSEYKHEAAFNRILCYYKLCGNDPIPDSLTIYIDEFLGTAKILPVKVADKFEMKLLQACNDNIRLLPDSKWYDQVLMKYGETLHKLSAFDAAAEVYIHVVERGADGPYHLQAALNAAQCYYDGNRFEQAEIWFRNVAEHYPDSTRYVVKAQKMAASTQFKIAAQTSDNGDAITAATQFYNIAKSATDPQIKLRALFEAAGQYQKANDLMKAALAYEELVQQHPSAELADEALYKAAGLREMSDQWEVAAADYLKLVDGYPKSEFASRALKNAAVCYENKEDWFAAERVYRRYATTFTQDPDELLEVMYKIGEMSYNFGDMKLAVNGFRETVEAHRRFRSKTTLVGDYFPAKAQFMIGEVEFDEYKKLEIAPPLEKNLERKKTKFKRVFAEYRNTLEYQVADWSTAASYRIGMAFEEFGRALIESPRPKGLDEEQAKLYNQKLAESAMPYRQKALETYRKNILQAEKNQVENMWVEESRKRMNTLNIELNLTSPPATGSTSTADIQHQGESD